MNPSELLLTANKIAASHVTNGDDLNASIIKIAIEQDLTKPQIERLVEETNKATFLTLLEKKGEQEFPIASYDTIKSGLVPKIEKVAGVNIKFEDISYSNDTFKEIIGTKHINNNIEKIANEITLTEDEVVHVEALFKVANDIWFNYNRFMDLETLGQKRYGYKHSNAIDLVKIASEHNDYEIKELETLEKYIIKQGQILEIIYNGMQKTANMLWGETNPYTAAAHAGGSIFNRSAKAAGALVNMGTKAVVGGTAAGIGGAAKIALKGAAVAAPVAIPLAGRLATKNLNTTLTLGTEGSRAYQHAKTVAKGHNLIGPGANVFREALGMEKQAFVEELAPVVKPLFQSALKWGGRALGVSQAVGKLTQNTTGMIGPGKIALASESLNKNASVVGIQHVLDFLTPMATLGPFAGITAAAAKKLGGGIALTMNKKEFDNSFDTIMKNNPDLAENKQQVRGYFDVVSRHAPSLAKDPLVAESIVKNMNAFGGVDYNTIRGLRETEALGKRDDRNGLASLLPVGKFS